MPDEIDGQAYAAKVTIRVHVGKTIAWGGPTVGSLIPNLGSNVLCHPVLGKRCGGGSMCRVLDLAFG